MRHAARVAIDLLERSLAALPNSETRDGQVDMVQQVADAIDLGGTLVVQAGTGTGKTLGYLIPILASGRTAVVATYTKALQDQLASVDLPFLSAVTESTPNMQFAWAILKGRNNYVCRQRLSELSSEQFTLDGESTSPDIHQQIHQIIDWAEHTETGDQSDVPFPVSETAWRKVSVGSDECPGASKCAFGETCFTEHARERAANANVVVVNFALYGLHLQHDRELLPPHDVVVFDEAHELEDVISDTASVVLTARSVANAAESARRALKSQRVPNALTSSAKDFDEILERFTGQRFRSQLEPDIDTVLRTINSQVNLAIEQLRASPTESPEVLRATTVLTRLYDDVERVLSSSSDMVVFIDESRGAPRLTAAPLRVDGVLQPVWHDTCAILTSATIPPGLPSRLGLPYDDDHIVQVKSPFDYQRNSLLYIAGDLPEPNAVDRQQHLVSRIIELIRMSQGSALVLFTSWGVLNSTLAPVRTALADEFLVLAQDDMPKKVLLDTFREKVSSCLFATRGFFQGVDVPGSSLRLVIIDKVPFPALRDPLLDARRELFGQSSFMQIDVPIAAASLAQAAGRLIRSTNDHGVVAVLDPRLLTKRYKSSVLHGVSHMPETSRIDEVAEFFSSRAE